MSGRRGQYELRLAVPIRCVSTIQSILTLSCGRSYDDNAHYAFADECRRVPDFSGTLIDAPTVINARRRIIDEISATVSPTTVFTVPPFRHFMEVSPNASLSIYVTNNERVLTAPSLRHFE